MTYFAKHKSGDDARVADPLFHMGSGGSIPTSPLQLKIVQMPIRKARELNMLWHSRLPIYETGCCLKARICFGAMHDGLYYAIAIWDNPTARALPQHKWLELKRMAIANDAPKNTASRMLKIMRLKIRKMLPGIERLISYQDVEAHSGTIYKASGWIPVHKHNGGSWWRKGQKRFRPDLNAATGPKIRWEITV